MLTSKIFAYGKSFVVFKIIYALNATRLFILPVFELDLGSRLSRAGRGAAGR